MLLRIKLIQSISDFQTGIGAAAFAALEIKQLITHTRTVIVDITTSLQGSDRGDNSFTNA